MELASSFEQVSNESASHFIQHVVVVDNQLYYVIGEELTDSTNLSEDVVEPTAGPKTGAEASQDEDHVRTGSLNARNLNAKALVEAFSDEGIICCPYRPDDENDEIVVERAASIGRNADILVLDWELGGGGDRAVSIIKRIVTKDQETGGRIRLIAVYTGDPNLASIISIVKKEVFPHLGKVDSGCFELHDKHTHVVFYAKKGLVPDILADRRLPEEKLPKQLVSDFAAASYGLVPNVALKALAKVRDAAHHVLSRYDKRLDPALLTHRALIDYPEDAEQFVLDLLAGELRSILMASDIGSTQFGNESIRLWLEKANFKGNKI